GRSFAQARKPPTLDQRTLAIKGESLQVHTRAKSVAGASQDADRDIIVGIELIERLGQLMGGFVIDGVARIRSIDRNNLNLLDYFNFHQVGHSATPEKNHLR